MSGLPPPPAMSSPGHNPYARQLGGSASYYPPPPADANTQQYSYANPPNPVDPTGQQQYAGQAIPPNPYPQQSYTNPPAQGSFAAPDPNAAYQQSHPTPQYPPQTNPQQYYNPQQQHTQQYPQQYQTQQQNPQSPYQPQHYNSQYQNPTLPPMGGANNLPPSVPASSAPNTVKSPPAPRIDPAQVPSPATVAPGQMVKYLSGSGPCPIPPPAATQYIALDEGNATPRYMRMTLYTLPCNEDQQNTVHVPLAIIVQPLAEPGFGERSVPVVDLTQGGIGGPIRCRRCRAYMNPFNVFVDGGRKFVCRLCDCENDVPDAYFSPLEYSGKRHDYLMRPELSQGSIDLVAPPEYLTQGKPPAVPSFVFVIDVSEYSISSGLLHTTVHTLRNLLPSISEMNNAPQNAGNNSQNSVEPKIAIVTFDSTIHFWNIRGNLQQPQMLVVPDVSNVFVPMPQGVLVRYSEAKSVVDTLLDRLGTMFQGNATSSPISVVAPAIQAASLAIEATGVGKVFAFVAGALDGNVAKRREDLKLMNTDKEKSLYTVRNAQLKTLATDCAKSGASVELFVCPSSATLPCDLASLAAIPNITGGNLYYYPGFTYDKDGARLSAEMSRVVLRPYGYDAIARLRTSRGLSITEHSGNVSVTSSQDLEMAGIDADRAIVVHLKHDDKLDDKTEPVLQFAMLYTNNRGERRIRVHTISLNCSSTLHTIFRNADLDAILHVFARNAVKEMSNSPLSVVRQNLTDRCVEALASYRKHCAATTSPGQLILPESLKLLPVYVLALTKNTLLRPAPDVSPDDRTFAASIYFNASSAVTTPFTYPRLYALHKSAGTEEGVRDVEGRVSLPAITRCTSHYLDPEGVYLAENGKNMYLWLARNADPVYAELLAPDSATELSEQARNIASSILVQRCKGTAVQIVLPRSVAPPGSEALDRQMMTWLVEDEANGVMSYVDYLCQVHKLIQSRLS